MRGDAPVTPQPGAADERSPGLPPAAFVVSTALWSFGVAVAEPFLNAYLWSLRSTWVLIGLFNLAQYLAMVLTFPAAGRLAKRRGAGASLRLAMLAVVLAFLSALVLGRSAPRYALGLGLLLGMGWGLYWLAEYVFSLDLTGRGSGRDRWQSLLGLLTTGSGLVAPLAAGSIVAAAGGIAGFRWLLAAALALIAVAAAVAGHLPARRLAAPFRLWAGWPGQRRNDPWARVLAAQMALALSDGVYLFAPALLVFTLSGSALDLGVYLTATQSVSLAAYLAGERWGAPARRRPALLLGSLLSTAAGLMLVLGFGTALVWGFGLATSALLPLLRVPIEACTLDVIAARTGPDGTGVEHTALKEMTVNAARTVSVGVMVLAVAWAGPAAVRWFLAGVSVCPWCAWWSLRQVPPPEI